MSAPVSAKKLAAYAEWPQRLRNNIGSRTVQTDDVSAQMQVIPVIEHLVAEVRRLKVRAECPYEAGCPWHGPPPFAEDSLG